MIEQSDLIKKGIYQHYKQKYYEVLEIARHSETLEYLVVYRMLADDFGLWVRPLSMFIEQVEVNGQQLARFQFIAAMNAAEFLQQLD